MNDIESLETEGFTGFLSVRHLLGSSLREVPQRMGVYVVVRTTHEAHEFLTRSPAGHFKGQDPSVTVDVLEENWIEGAVVLNFGKAGGPGSNSTLRSRLKQYLDFGSGKPVGHRGGRLIWQLADAQDLLIGWKAMESGIPRDVENGFIRAFKESHGGRRPFANLQD